MKAFIRRFGPALTALALVVTTASANAACSWLCYQSTLPEGAAKLRKF